MSWRDHWPAVEPLVARRAAQATRWAPHLGRADVYQQAALVALEALQRWRPSHGPVRGYVSSAVYRSLLRYTADHRHTLRQPRCAETTPPQDPDQLAGWEPDAELDPVDAARLRRTALQLDPVVLAALAGEPVTELAQKAGVSRRTLSRRKADAVRQLRGELVR